MTRVSLTQYERSHTQQEAICQVSKELKRQSSLVGEATKPQWQKDADRLGYTPEEYLALLVRELNQKITRSVELSELDRKIQNTISF